MANNKHPSQLKASGNEIVVWEDDESNAGDLEDLVNQMDIDTISPQLEYNNNTEEEEKFLEAAAARYASYYVTLFDTTRRSWQRIGRNLEAKLKRLAFITDLREIYTCLDEQELEVSHFIYLFISLFTLYLKLICAFLVVSW